MPASRDAQEVVNAIKENTRELKKVREAIEKVARSLSPRDDIRTFSGYSPEPIDYDNSTIDGPNGPIEPR